MHQLCHGKTTQSEVKDFGHILFVFHFTLYIYLLSFIFIITILF